MDFGNLQEIYFTIRKNKLRTFLTAFGVFWGIFMLIILLGAGNGLQNGIRSNFASDDLTSIWIGGGSTAIAYKGFPANRRIEFTEDDIAAIKRDVVGVNYISAENQAGSRWQRTVNVSYKSKSVAFGVYGVASDFFRIKIYQEQRAGRQLNWLDERDKRKVATIGTKVRDGLFSPDEDPIGKYILFHGVMLKVVGVFYDKGAQERHDERVYLPLSTFQKVFGRARKVGIITVTPKPGVDPFAFEENVISVLKERHSIAPDDKRAIGFNNLSRQTKEIGDLFGAISAFIWFVGLGTLTAGIVGISNIMIITVKDRTREIGVRKALGAPPFSIVTMILTESVLITAVAGYMGLVFGVMLLEGVSAVFSAMGPGTDRFFQRPEVELSTAIDAVLVLIVAGALAGLAPALRAAKIMPVDAMREE